MRWLFWIHRWLGIATCLFCIMWLVSGLVMLYVPYPSWRDDERIAFLPVVDAGRIAVPPDEALAKAGLSRAPTVFRLEMHGDEPIYRIVDFGKPVSVSAVDGRLIDSIAADEARHILARSVGTPPTYLGSIDADQWTVTRLFAAHRPLHLFELGDAHGSRYYLSSRTGEIVQSTTRQERLWNWMGSVPHWLYFTVLRANPGLWRDAVLWTAGTAAVGSVLGIWIGILRVRVRARYGGRRISPYRGVMKWHHIGGLLGGIFLTAWLASGWLSVGPFGLFNNLPVTPDQLARYYIASAPTFDASVSVLASRIGPQTKEVQFTWVGGDPLFVTTDGISLSAYDARDGAPLMMTEGRILAAVAAAFPENRIKQVQRLDAHDAYWYVHRSMRPLPALRIALDDPSQTWLTADLTTGRIVGASDQQDRLRRWLFNFVHLYDHPALLRRPMVREALIWILSFGGLVVSLTGALIGMRSLRPRPSQARVLK